ncbi:ribonuclease E activity regulator RraA [Streptomyces sp. NPDC054840]
MSGSDFRIATGDKHLAQATVQLLGHEAWSCRPTRWKQAPARTRGCGPQGTTASLNRLAAPDDRPLTPTAPPRRTSTSTSTSSEETGSRMSVTLVPTADLYDEHGESLAICATGFRRFGGRRVFACPVRTVRCHEDNALLRTLIHTPGEGAVLVVDGGGSPRTALVGDLIAGAAEANGWAGPIVNGSVRDSVALGGLDFGGLDLGIKALGTVPRKSGKSGKTGDGAVDEPVTIGDVTFRAGDTVHADDDGVVVLPR